MDEYDDETQGAIRGLFDIDWAIAVHTHNLAWFIIKSQNDPDCWRGSGPCSLAVK